MISRRLLAQTGLGLAASLALHPGTAQAQESQIIADMRKPCQTTSNRVPASNRHDRFTMLNPPVNFLCTVLIFFLEKPCPANSLTFRSFPGPVRTSPDEFRL